MDENLKMIESLLEKTTDYGKTTLELYRLKTIDKISGAVSIFIPYMIVILIVITCLFFISLGLAFLIGKKLDNISLGFFAVGALYGLIGGGVYLFVFKKIKLIVGNCLAKYLS